MSSQRLLAEMARRERLQEWMKALEKRLSVERRFKTLIALRRELTKCEDEAKASQELIVRYKPRNRNPKQAKPSGAIAAIPKRPPLAPDGPRERGGGIHSLREVHYERSK